jgi:Outer membrane lipoprotein
MNSRRRVNSAVGRNVMFILKHINLTSLLALFLLTGPIGGQISFGQSQSESVADKLQRAEQAISRLRSQEEPRDINLARQAASELNSILRIEPKTVFLNQVEYDLDWVNDILAKHDLQVASFYMARPHASRASETRLLEITRNYPKFSKMDEVFFRLGVVALQDERSDDASKYLRTLICKHLGSEYVDFAFRELNRIGLNPSEGCDKLRP